MNFDQLNEWLVALEGSDIPTKLFQNVKPYYCTNYVHIEHVDKQLNAIVLNCTFGIHSSRKYTARFMLNIPYPLTVSDYESFYDLFLTCLGDQYPELVI